MGHEKLQLGGAAVDFIHVGDEVEELVGVAPLVVVPGDKLDEVIVLGIASIFRYAENSLALMVILP